MVGSYIPIANPGVARHTANEWDMGAKQLIKRERILIYGRRMNFIVIGAAWALDVNNLGRAGRDVPGSCFWVGKQGQIFLYPARKFLALSV